MFELSSRYGPRAAARAIILAAGLAAAGCAFNWPASKGTSQNLPNAAAADGYDSTVEPGASSSTGYPSRYRIDIAAPADLASLIRERTLLGRWQDRPEYDPDQFESLFARLPDEVRALARQQGYFSPSISISGDPRAIRIEVDPGAQTQVRSIQIRFRGEVAADPELSEQVRARWRLPEGSPFLPERWEQSKRALIEALHATGFLRARIVQSEAGVDPGTAAADLSLSIDSGSRLAFGPLRIQGLERYDTKLVDNLRTFKFGEPYQAEQLSRMQLRLAEVGYFSSATVVPDIDAIERDSHLDRVPVMVEVRELPGRRVALGAGFSTDNGPRAQLGLDQRNLFGTGWQAESVLLVEGSRQRLFANVRSPLESDGRYTGLGSSLDRQDIAGERVLRTSTYAGMGRRRTDGDGFLSLTHQSERRRLAAGGDQPAETDSRKAWALGYTHTLSRVDSPLDPRKGYALQAQLSGASRNLGSDRSFVRTYVRGRHFWPVASDGAFAGGVVVGHAEAGAVFAGSRENIPSENLFRTGGAQSLRGYRYLSIGVPDAGAVVGGRYLALGSLEYQHPVNATVRGAVFYDRGNATDSLSGFTTFAGYGAGVRWKTPVGPVIIDVAWGEDSRQPRLHFAVGYGF